MIDKKDVVVDGEPSIVTDIRKLIGTEFSGLRFDEIPHKYYLGGRELPSVTQITHKFKKETDFADVAVNYARNNGFTPEYWLDKWKFINLKATVTGTSVHEYGESLGWLRNGHPEFITDENKVKYVADKGWLIPTRAKEEAVLKFYDEFPDGLHFVTAEAKVFSNKGAKSMVKTQFAGTFDLLAYYVDKNYHDNDGLVVLDWKTNKSLVDAYNRENGKYLLPPFNNMIDENLSIYTIQLSLYSLCLRGIGLDVKGCRVIWLKDDGTYELIKVRDLSSDEGFKDNF